MKQKIFSDVLNKDFYEFYKTTVKYPLSEKLYTSIVGDFNTEIRNLITDGFKIYYYTGLSSFFITERKRIYRVNSVGDPILPVNWAATKQYNKGKPKEQHIRIYISDDPYYYRISWFKYINAHLPSYKFIGCTSFRKEIREKIIQDPLIRLKYRSNTCPPDKRLDYSKKTK